MQTLLILIVFLIFVNMVINNYYFGVSKEQFEEIKSLLINVNHKLKTIMSTQAEIAQGLNDLTTQVAKVAVESKATLQKVSDLEAELANQDNVSPALQAAFDALKVQVQTVDDLIPDVTPPTTDPSGPTAG